MSLDGDPNAAPQSEVKEAVRMNSRRWLILVALLGLVGLLAAPIEAQSPPPIAFGDPEPSVVRWPEAITATVLNNTTETIEVNVQFSDFTDSRGTAARSPMELLQSYPPSITLAPAGQASLTAVLNTAVPLAPGNYTASLVLVVDSHNAVLRKDVTIAVPGGTSASTLTPAVEAWTLNAIRVLPFLDPICFRGLVFGCSLPLVDAQGLPETSTTLGYLSNARGGGLTITLRGAATDDDARLGLAFDRRWGLTGTYTGVAGFVPSELEAGTVALTVNVKDIIVWPLLCLVLGVAAARQVQRYLTVRRTSLELLQRLNTVGLTFAKLRKSIHGYTVAEDFHAERARLDAAIRAWDRTHFGELTEGERERFATTILKPLSALENQIEIWAQFRDKLEHLGRKLLHDARPAVEKAAPPSDINLEEPRFYGAGRDLLRGSKLQIAQVPALAERIDRSAELAGTWGELYQLSVLVRDAISELRQPGVELSEGEVEMLEAARHHLNSAARDLWEAPDLDDLRRRETEHELATAQELTRRLLDPFVYYAGSEVTDQIRAMESETDEAKAAESFPIQLLGRLQPLVRVYARLEAFRLPRLDWARYQSLTSDAARFDFTERALLVSERTVALIALMTAAVGGLERYFTTNFGSLADYLAVLTWGLATKAGLEVANALLSRMVRQTRNGE
jgi:hypothetical protein